jgi:hypothetical protein
LVTIALALLFFSSSYFGLNWWLGSGSFFVLYFDFFSNSFDLGLAMMGLAFPYI